MSSGERRVWNLWRQLPGNLIPVVLVLPILWLAIQETSRNGLTVKTVLLAAAFFAFGWLSVNFLGLIGNRGLKRKLDFRYRNEFPEDHSKRIFVGFSRPGKHGLLDPHEDLGWLVFQDSGLLFWGEKHQIELPWSVIQSVSKRRNIHSWIGLGGWVAIEALVGDKKIRLQVEPRVKTTHWGNNHYRNLLISDLDAILAEKSA